ncbi:mevalonate kinase [Lasius niger]|uniref:Mevalonate kinase n=1 Tax=Lasius niger TaxID=67767 RepID=A0A0J7KJD3_LASNI|nr:mevalonate kinase [Lasius niger]
MFGADNYVCSYGKTIKSRYDQDSYYNDIINMPTMKILLIDTNIRQNKGERATQIAELKHSRPELVDYNLRKYNISSTDICTNLVAMHNISQQDSIPLLEIQESVYQQLQTLIYEDQLIVQNLGLSHPSIDMIGSITRDLGCWGNPTGFGGLVFILLPPIIPEELFRNLERHLREMGFNIKRARVCCSGVRIDD